MSKVQQSSAVLLESAGRFFFYQPETGIIASGENVDAAYANFSGARQQYYADMARAGLDVPLPPEVVARRRFLASLGKEMGVILGRISIVVIVIATLGVAVAQGVRSGVDRLTDMIALEFDSAQPLSLRDVVKKAEDVARDTQDLTDKQRDTLRRSIGTISRELSPLIDAWRNPPQAQPKAAEPNTSQIIEKVAPDQIITSPAK